MAISPENKEFLKGQFSRAGLKVPGWSGNQKFLTSQGHKIRWGHAPAYGDPAKSARGAVIITTGYDEQIELYHHAIKYYQNQGFNVLAFDWHNHGLSGRDHPDTPSRPSERGLNRHVKDLHDFVSAYKQGNLKTKDYKTGQTYHLKYNPVEGPLVASTHSMGGHNVMLALEKHPDMFDSAVLTAPLFDITYKGLPKGVIRGIFHGAQSLGLGHFSPPRPKQLKEKFRLAAVNVQKNLVGCTRQFNVSVLKPLTNKLHSLASVFGAEGATRAMVDYIHDKAVKISDKFKISNKPRILSSRHHYSLKQRSRFLAQRVATPTFNWIAGSFETSDELMDPENLKRVKVPLFIASAENDDLVENRSHKTAMAYLPKGSQHLLLKNSSHGIWFEKEPVFQKLVNNVSNHLNKTVTRYHAARTPQNGVGKRFIARKNDDGENNPPNIKDLKTPPQSPPDSSAAASPV